MSLVDSLGGVVVLALGDVMLDEYVWGEVRRISPEAPVPVVEIRQRTAVPGGAANVAAGVVALGGSALLCGVVGADAAAGVVREAAVRAGVDVAGLAVDSGRPTTTKTRVIAHAQQVVRTDAEDRSPLAAEVEDRLVDWARERVGEADAVAISDYAKGVVSDRVAAAVIEAARAAGRPVVVDPKGLRYEKYRGATLITPNADDAARAANVHLEGEGDLVEAARRLAEASGGARLLVTRGAAGMSLFGDGEPLQIPAEARDVYDVTGAGDTVVAVLAAALGAGIALEDAVRLANSAAGIVVGKVGTATVGADELAARLG